MRRALLIMTALLLPLLPCRSGAQATSPRFLLATSDTTRPSLDVNPADWPAFRRLISLQLGRVPRKDALRRIGAVSGLQFVYANDLIAAEDTVRLEVSSVSVADALRQVLRSSQIDVVLSTTSESVVLVRHRMTPARADVITGRVTSDAGASLAGAHVIVTRGPDRAMFQAVSAGDGRYRIAVDSGTGDYLVYVSVPESMRMPPFRKRVTSQTPNDSVFVVDAVLHAQQTAQQLSTVRVQTRKPTPVRGEDVSAGPGASEFAAPGVAAALLPDQDGDLVAMSALMPGTTVTASGVSAFGLPSGQNSVTLNGLAFPGTAVPRDALTTVRTVTNSYDPSRGWFGGASTRVDLSHDFLYSKSTTSSSLSAAPFDMGTGNSGRTGQNFTTLTQGAGSTGWLSTGKATYNVSVQATRQSADVATLADADADMLRRAGVSADSVSRLFQGARQVGLPLAAPGMPTGLVTNGASLLLSAGSVTRDMLSYRPVRNVISATVFASNQETDGDDLEMLRASTADMRSSSTLGAGQVSWSSFLAPGVLQEVRSSVSLSERRHSPYLEVPAAHVLLGSSFAGATGGLAFTSLGGAGSGPANTRAFTWESQGDTRFYSTEAHQLRVSADVRYDALSSREGLNTAGAFVYNSLDDFAKARPAFFTRTLNAPERRAGAWNGFVSLGDYWKPAATLDLLYGIRVEGNAFTQRPTYNPAVAAAFGARTDHAPNTIGISPRLGFNWKYNDQTNYGGNTIHSDHGRFIMPSLGTLRGGIGAFRAMLSPELISDALASTGLGDGRRQIVCTGAAVPTPDWAAYAMSASAIPQECLPTAGATAFGDGASPVRLIARDLTAPTSWRANLAWTSYYDAVVWTIEGIVARNVYQPGQVDLNFRGVPAFYLASEANRPVFVPPSSIVPSSGVVLARDGRVNTAFGSVMQTQSSRHSDAALLTTSVVPDLSRFAKSRLFASLSYTLSRARAEHGGFEQSTFASPQGSTWSRSSLVPTHSFLLQGSVRAKYVTIGIFGRIASGLPFTPMIGSDINGDGMANDRAFITDPASAADQGMAASMRSLLASAPSNVRTCLMQQLGRPAADNICTGPWTATLNARLHLNTSQSDGWARRLNASLYLANPLAGLDQMLHGSKLRGWGGTATPDQVLMRATGFDPATSAFRYAVNPRFGDTRSTNAAFAAPFRVILDIRLDFGAPFEQQIVTRTLQAGRDGRGGQKRSAEETKRFYRMASSGVDPFALVLSLSDSLLLTGDQIRSVVAGQERYSARVDSALTTFSDWMASLPVRYDAANALRRQTEWYEAVLNIGREEAQASIKPVLTPIQLRLLPFPFDVMMRATDHLTMRDVRR